MDTSKGRGNVQVRAMAETAQRIWFATFSGLYYYDEELNEVVYCEYDELKHKQIRDLQVFDGKLFVCASDGLYEYKISNSRGKKVVKDIRFVTLTRNSKGQLFGLSSLNRIYRVNPDFSLDTLSFRLETNGWMRKIIADAKDRLG